MRVKFTKASKKDKTLVTVHLAQFDEEFDDLSGDWRSEIDDVIRLTIDGQEVAFTVNRVRDGKAITATTHCFPRYLTLPRIGHPTYAQVTEVK